MTKPARDRLHRERGKVVERARTLARSGQFPDHAAIIQQLEAMEGFAAARDRFEDRASRAQLDRLCALARGANRERLAEAPPHASTRA